MLVPPASKVFQQQVFKQFYRLLVKRLVNPLFCTSYYYFICRWRQTYLHLQIKTAAKQFFFLSWRICNKLDVKSAGLQVASQFHEVLRIKKKRECYIGVCSTINDLDLLSSERLAWPVPLLGLIQNIFNLVKK